MISVVARMLGIHPQTLRLYEREGLVEPHRTKGNTRLYSERDVERVRKIMTLTRDLGVNLAGAQIIMNLQRELEELRENVQRFMQFVDSELSREFTDFGSRFDKALVKSPHRQVVQSLLSKEKK